MILLLFLNFLFTDSDTLTSNLVKEASVKDFMDAVSVTQDGKENIYVLDAAANQIIKYSNKLEYKKRNGKQGWAEGQYDSPTYIDGSSGLDILVSDGKNSRVQRLDLELNPISVLYTDLADISVELRYRTPVASLVMNSNQLFVIDKDNQRVVVYNDGRLASGIFGDYKSKGKLGEPVKILKDSKNYIYILDKEQKGIMRYDNLGNFIKKITINDLDNFSIRDNILYLFDGSEITKYDLDLNSVIDKVSLPKTKKKIRYKDFLVISDEKYLLLSKNELSLWVKK
ncbi:MAG TPA: hypothetical protein PKA90_10675 [Ignavibacteria bacterium]|nr:hypothetical protein [Ignavibacteria bacterium]